MAPKKDDPVEKLSGMIETILDKREQRKAEEKDPKARFDRMMDRLENFLDASEGKGKEPAKSKADDDDGDEGIVSALFGKGKAS
jgi:hypothetical protein